MIHYPKLRRSLISAGIALGFAALAATATTSPASAAPAAPTAATRASVSYCNAYMEGGGYVEMATTLLSSRQGVGNYQVALTSYAKRRVSIRWDKVIDALGRAWHGVTGNLDVGETRYFNADGVWMDGAIVTGGFVDTRSDTGAATCGI